MPLESPSLDDLFERALKDAFGPLAEGPGSMSRIGAAAGPGHPAGADEHESPLPSNVGTFALGDVIGEGGMGIVAAATDEKLGRQVAVKLLRNRHAKDERLVRSFLEEARITSRLQHPGIVPVHDVGVDASGRPYFAMKLVEGRTLRDLLVAKSGSDSDLTELLRVFESVAETMAYVHAAGHIHRDLKPSNILTGSFGEVMIMDWGLAIPAPEAGGSAARIAVPVDRPRIAGTPAYMAPEQARGEMSTLDARADVFSLGAVLCEILTNQPPYVAETEGEVLLLASRGWTEEGVSRIEHSGADPALTRLACACLATAREARPRDAGAVLTAIRAWRADFVDRLRAREIEAAEARATAASERRARRTVVALAAVIIATIAIGALAAVSWSNERRRRHADEIVAARSALARLRALHDAAVASPFGSLDPWNRALTAATETAEILTKNGARPEFATEISGELVAIRAARDRAASALETARRLRELEEHVGDLRDLAVTTSKYDALFREALVDPATQPPADVAKSIREHLQRDALVSGLDDWATCAAQLGRKELAANLVAVAMLADPDGFRNDVRKARLANDKNAVLALAEKPPADVVSLRILAIALMGAGEPARAVACLRTAHDLRPDSFVVNHQLGAALRRGTRADHDEALRHFSMALAVDPSSIHLRLDLGQLLVHVGRYDEGLRILDDASRREPENPFAWLYAGEARLRTGETAAGMADLDQARTLAPDDPRILAAVGTALVSIGHFAAARPGLETAARSDARTTESLAALAIARGETGDAAGSFELLVKLTESLAPQYPPGWHLLGLAHARSGRVDDAIGAMERAIELDPRLAEAHCDLASVFMRLERFEDAVRHYRKGHELGLARGPQWKFDSATWLRDAEEALKSR